MNKKFYTVFLAVILTTSYAQAQFIFGVRTGFNSTRYFEYEATKKQVSNYTSGFQLGVVSEYTLSNAFAINYSILFATQGGQYEDTFFSWTRDVNYLQIPINALCKLNIGEIKLLLQAGPYLGYALNGKYQWDSSYLSWGQPPGKYKIKFGYDHEENMMKPFDYGINLGTGLQYSNMQIAFEYNIGLANLSTVPKSWNYSLKNNGYTITATYMFGKKE